MIYEWIRFCRNSKKDLTGFLCVPVLCQRTAICAISAELKCVSRELLTLSHKELIEISLGPWLSVCHCCVPGQCAARMTTLKCLLKTKARVLLTCPIRLTETYFLNFISEVFLWSCCVNFKDLCSIILYSWTNSWGLYFDDNMIKSFITIDSFVSMQIR